MSRPTKENPERLAAIVMQGVNRKPSEQQAYTAPDFSSSGRIEHFKFNLGERVIIREIQRPGRIESLLIDCLGPQYRVAYWDNSKRESAWLNADELDAR